MTKKQTDFMTTYSNDEASVSPWEIRIAYVKFVDKPNKGMVHPVLILKAGINFATVLQFTSKSDNSNYPKIEIEEWMDLNFRTQTFLKLEPAYNVLYTNISETKLGDAPKWLIDAVKTYYFNSGDK